MIKKLTVAELKEILDDLKKDSRTHSESFEAVARALTALDSTDKTLHDALVSIHRHNKSHCNAINNLEKRLSNLTKTVDELVLGNKEPGV